MSRSIEQAKLFSLEGVIFPFRHPFQLQQLRRYFLDDPIHYIPPQISLLQRPVEESSRMTFHEIAEFHRRSTSRSNEEIFNYLWNQAADADMYINTGRPNKQAWHEMTRRTLANSGIDTCFSGMFFRPSHVTGIESKGAAILELAGRYRKVTHYDIDPWVIFGLAKTFREYPGVNFVIVSTMSSGILMSQEEEKRFPNVRRIAVFPEPDIYGPVAIP